MVDHIKRSFRDLEPPSCVACEVAMKWYRSELLPEDAESIAHYFQCPNCSRVVRMKSKRDAPKPRIDPSSLSRPAERFFCEAA